MLPNLSAFQVLEAERKKQQYPSNIPDISPAPMSHLPKNIAQERDAPRALLQKPYLSPQ